MAKTIRTYLGEVGRTLYPIDFNMGYLDKSDVHIYSGTDPNVQLSYTWVNSTQIQLSTPFTVGQEFYIRRIIQRNLPINDYEDGAILSEKNLDDSYKQALMILEEIEDGFVTDSEVWEIVNKILMKNVLDMGGNKIVNLPLPTEEHEPVIQKQLTDLYDLLTTYSSSDALAAALGVENSSVLVSGKLAKNVVRAKVFALLKMPPDQQTYIADFNTVSQDRTSVRAALQSLIDSVSESSATGITEIDLGGYVYAVDGHLIIKNRVVLVNGTISDNATSAGESVIRIGVPTGGSLTRPAGCDNIYVITTSPNEGVCGFRIDTLVRSSWFKNCIAFMNASTTRTQNAFEIVSTTIANATTGGVGAYQNLIEGCTGINATWACRLYTRGTLVEILAQGPQSSGNKVDIRAFSCYRGALDMYGAQENDCVVRADTFVPQGVGSRIDVVNVDGSYNKVKFVEEIGSRAETQYSVRLGEFAIYNEVEGSTQNIVTGFLDDTSSPVGKRPKNIVKQTGSGLLSRMGGRSDTITARKETPAGSTTIPVFVFVAPRKCIVTHFSGYTEVTAPAGGSSFLYFAKNGVTSTSNRLTWAAGEAASSKTTQVDTGAATDINERWVLEAGDRLNILVTTPAGGGLNVNATAHILYI